MTYLTYVWNMLVNNTGTIAVILGNMLVVICFLRPRWKWWLYPAMVSVTILCIPLIYILFTGLLGWSYKSSLFLAFLGYWDDILILASFKEGFFQTITLIFGLSILNRMFTFWGYMLYIPLNHAAGGGMDVQLSAVIVLVVMYSIISLVCWLFLREKGHQLIQTRLPRNSWRVLAGIVVAAKLIIDLCSDYAFDLNPYSDTQIIWAMIALCTFALAVLVLYLYNTEITLKHIELKASASRLSFEKEAQQRYYEAQLNNQNELRRIKHDMNGHISTVSQLLADDNKDAAVKYLSSLRKHMESRQKKLYLSDPYLNAVVTNFTNVFLENNIPFENDIQEVRIGLHQVEVCLALNNALQNALEASLKLPADKRYVKLQVKEKQGHLLFRVTNRFDEKLIIKDGLPSSTKEASGHGYGLISIKSAAESLGGFAAFKVEGNMFLLDVAM